MVRDSCGASLAFNTDPTAETITGVTLTATGNTCSTVIPVTVPGSVTSTQGFTTEQIGKLQPFLSLSRDVYANTFSGSDPLTIWVQMSGSPVTFTLSIPVPL
jgi:hypothetical protein